VSFFHHYKLMISHTTGPIIHHYKSIIMKQQKENRHTADMGAILLFQKHSVLRLLQDGAA